LLIPWPVAEAPSANLNPTSLDYGVSEPRLRSTLAYLGLLDDAAPLFREGSSFPGVGVLRPAQSDQMTDRVLSILRWVYLKLLTVTWGKASPTAGDFASGPMD
jgi:hypothetical protein